MKMKSPIHVVITGERGIGKTTPDAKPLHDECTDFIFGYKETP